MKSFICEVLEKLQNSGNSISEMVFVLPSKRAGAYLLKELSEIVTQPAFAPKVLSIEEFTEEISGLQAIDNTISLFEFYEAYKHITPAEEKEDFETFITWAQSLIHDFNEIDRYLIDYRPFFDYLSGIQDIKHWYLQDEKTELIQRYLKFWKKLPDFYEELRERLLKEGKGYQGLIYRKAAENVTNYLVNNNTAHIFIGFNALNSAEQHIFQQFLEDGQSQVFWDIDRVFYEDPVHSAGMFMRDYFSNWNYYQQKPFQEQANLFSNSKKMEIIGIPKNIGQAKYLGEILQQIPKEELENTAIILGEEELLLPTLNSLPPSITELNITMGYPVKNAPVNALFEALFQLHSQEQSQYYYKDVVSILSHPSMESMLGESAQVFIQKLRKENIVYFGYELIAAHFKDPEHQKVIRAAFQPKKQTVTDFLKDVQQLIFSLKTILKEQEDKLALEFLYHYHTLFNKLSSLNAQYDHIQTVKSLYGFFRELVATENLDFQGRPFQGLQLMGMLESRALDFETVIITGLNEGTLPAGKSDSSFIPYDLKTEYGLPTYREKDAVYTYHFYRILQRAKKVYLLYNTEADGLNSGEKSRFITQLEVEKQPAHDLLQKVISPKVTIKPQELRQVEKTEAMMAKIKSLAVSGFSPSALTTYIRNPLDFYRQYILGIREQDEMEETVAFNTLGTVVHDSLEAFYKPLEGQFLSEEILLGFMGRADAEVARQFANTYSKAPMNRGKNLLIAEVAKRYLHNFLKFELDRVKIGDEIQILQIETNLKTAVAIESLDFPVYIRGKVDRFEAVNGLPLVIDYKTGRVENSKVTVENWEAITTDYDKYSKSFQILTYLSLLALDKDFTFPSEAGIISFKNLKSGLLKFEKKEPGSRKKDSLITTETIQDFQLELKKLIVEICDPEIPFVEKEIKTAYGSF
ncbi:MAG: PD-(D/E)XK nuclease family protein [Bacteroidota bacterium]|nr:PD-(D/E)XK nuclease family protein [Bacteroidota bacterium]